MSHICYFCASIGFDPFLPNAYWCVLQFVHNFDVWQVKAASVFFFFIGKLQVAAVGHSAQSQRHHRPPHFQITFKSHRRCPEATFIPLLATSLLNETEAVLGVRVDTTFGLLRWVYG